MVGTGTCECGCGLPTRIAQKTCRRNGDVKGRPRRFLAGHGGGHGRHGPFRGLDNYEPEDHGYTTPCWIWQGECNRENGYGRVVVQKRKLLAHRVLYERAKGPIPEGAQLDHLCRVRNCVNPDHLEPVNGAENVQRGSNAKLSQEDVAEIRRLMSEGVRSREIAERFGVHRVTVLKINCGMSRVAEPKVFT